MAAITNITAFVHWKSWTRILCYNGAIRRCWQISVSAGYKTQTVLGLENVSQLALLFDQNAHTELSTIPSMGPFYETVKLSQHTRSNSGLYGRAVGVTDPGPTLTKLHH